MQIICTLLQTDKMSAPHHSIFHRLDALPTAQPTASKHTILDRGTYGHQLTNTIIACPELWIHLSLFFMACIRHCFLPVSFMDVIITPIIKNKGGNLMDVNNYRAIVLSNVDSKILERLLLSKTKENASNGDKYQFSFKAGHSKLMCASVVKKLTITLIRSVMWI